MAKIIMALIVVIWFLPANAQLYKWVDENGVTHYSNTAPPDSHQVETRTEAKGDPSPGSHSLDDVLDSYKRDEEEDRKYNSQQAAEPPESSEENGHTADYYAHRIKLQEARVRHCEDELKAVKRESFSNSIARNRRVRRYEYRLEKARLELERLQAKYRQAKYEE